MTDSTTVTGGGRKPPRTWVLVLNYQGKEHIANCLASLEKQTRPPGGVEVVVLDNGSDDGSLDIVRCHAPWARILENGDNLGFAAGNNVGMRAAIAAGAEYVALLNMDARVHPDWLAELVAVADEQTDAGLFGARVYNSDGRLVEFDGQQYDAVTTSGGYAYRPEASSPPRFQEAAYACGAALLARTRVLQEIGLFDESFFAYHEDVELSLRCWLHGHQVLNVANAIVYHDAGGAGAGHAFRDFMGTRNLAITLFKLYDRRAWASYTSDLTEFFLDVRAPHRKRSLISAIFAAPDTLRYRRAHRARGIGAYSDLLEQWKLSS